MAIDLENARERMVLEQLERRGIKDPRVLAAMRTVARHRFLPVELHEHAYDDGPLPIGDSQTISQPYMVALMSEVAELQGTEKVLEIGTGSGYQTECSRVSRVQSIPSSSTRIFTIAPVRFSTRWASATSIFDAPTVRMDGPRRRPSTS